MQFRVDQTILHDDETRLDAARRKLHGLYREFDPTRLEYAGVASSALSAADCTILSAGDGRFTVTYLQPYDEGGYEERLAITVIEGRYMATQHTVSDSQGRPGRSSTMTPDETSENLPRTDKAEPTDLPATGGETSSSTPTTPIDSAPQEKPSSAIEPQITHPITSHDANPANPGSQENSERPKATPEPEEVIRTRAILATVRRYLGEQGSTAKTAILADLAPYIVDPPKEIMEKLIPVATLSNPSVYLRISSSDWNMIVFYGHDTQQQERQMFLLFKKDAAHLLDMVSNFPTDDRSRNRASETGKPVQLNPT